MRMWVRRSGPLAIAIGLLLGACGGGSTPSAPGASPATTTPAIDPAEYQACSDQLSPFLSALHDLNSRLDIGLTQGDYNQKLGDIKVTYDQVIAAGTMGPNCVTLVGAPAEEAFNQYIRANDKWSSCVTDVNCSTNSIKSTLQAYWSSASEKLALADSGLSSTKPK